MFPLTRAEFKKSGKKYSRRFKLALALVSLLALLVSYLSFGYGFKSDSGIFTSASDVYVVDYRLFHHLMLDRETALEMLKDGKVDVFLTGRYIVISNAMKSHAAGEEMKNYIKGEFEKWIYGKYGIYAFPVMIRAEYLKRSIQPTLAPEPVSVEKIREVSEQVKRENRESPDSTVEKEIEKAVIGSERSGSGEGLIIPKKVEGRYLTPEEFSPPSLVSKMVLAFLFIVPPFFVMQVFSSSLAEDVRMKRLEVLLSTPIRPESIILQKLFPYFLVAVALTVIPSLIFRINGVAYMLAPLLMLFSAQAFMAVNSRSYRELTFLILVINLLVVVYLILPSVFSGLPLSDISPVTFLLRNLSGENVSPSDVALSSFPLATVALMMLHLTSRSLNIEILYSPLSPFERFVKVLGESARNDARAFLLSMASVFLALFLEFFLLFFGLSVPIVTSYAVIMLGVAIIEESLKSALIMPSKTISRAVAVAAGFFIAEKTLLIVNIFRDYSIVLPGEIFIFPLLLHTASSLSFAIVARRDWRAGFILAVLIHFAYNYGTVIML